MNLKRLLFLTGFAVFAAMIASHASEARVGERVSLPSSAPPDLHAAQALLEADLLAPLERRELDREMFSRLALPPLHVFRTRALPRVEGEPYARFRLEVLENQHRATAYLRPEPPEPILRAVATVRVDPDAGTVEVLPDGRKDATWMTAAAYLEDRGDV